MSDKSAELVYLQWRSLRTSTASHRMWCDCPDCKKRYRFAQAIVLPYAGPPASYRFKQEGVRA